MPDWGSLHPSTRRDASPALAAHREQPSLARQPAHFYAFIEVVSAPRRGYDELVATSRLTRKRSHTPSSTVGNAAAASPQKKAALERLPSPQGLLSTRTRRCAPPAPPSATATWI